MSKWLKAGRTPKILSCFGNYFSPEMRSSFHCNEFSTPASVPFIHSEHSLIPPFKAFPNNMTTFSCAPSEPSMWRITIHRLSVSLSPVFRSMGTWLRQLLKVCWSLSSLHGLTVFCVRHSRWDPTLWAVLMTSSITRTMSENLWCDRERRSIINKANDVDGCSNGCLEYTLRSQSGVTA